MKRRARQTSVLVLSAGLTVLSVGIAVIAFAEARPVSFSWLAYAPVSDTTFPPEGLHLVSTASILGVAIVVVGLLVLSAWFGYRQGARTLRPERLQFGDHPD